jgi:hypothetical protein
MFIVLISIVRIIMLYLQSPSCDVIVESVFELLLYRYQMNTCYRP